MNNIFHKFEYKQQVKLNNSRILEFSWRWAAIALDLNWSWSEVELVLSLTWARVELALRRRDIPIREHVFRQIIRGRVVAERMAQWEARGDIDSQGIRTFSGHPG